MMMICVMVGLFFIFLVYFILRLVVYGRFNMFFCFWFFSALRIREKLQEVGGVMRWGQKYIFQFLFCGVIMGLLFILIYDYSLYEVVCFIQFFWFYVLFIIFYCIFLDLGMVIVVYCYQFQGIEYYFLWFFYMWIIFWKQFFY